jgi:hypothetical protein
VTSPFLRVRVLCRVLLVFAAFLVLGVGPRLAAGHGAGLTVSAFGQAAGGLLAVDSEPGGTGWEANASALGAFVNQQFAYICPAYGSAGSVWGTGVYTYDSSVCTAAVLEGRITLAGGGKVVIEVLPGRGSYQGSTRNGISSNTYGSYFGSFRLVSSSAATAGVADGGTGWNADSAAYAGFIGAQFVFGCPANGAVGSVSGTGVYTDDSSICTAAVEEGRITLAGGGSVTVEIRTGQSSYAGSTSNGVTSSAYGAWPGSFSIVAASGTVPAVEPGGTGWDVGAGLLSGNAGARFVVECPAFGSPTEVWGTGVYTDDSSVCGAAALEGRISLAAGGTVTIEIRPGQSAYRGSSANGVTSLAYGAWARSYVLVAASASSGETGEGGTGWGVSATAYDGFPGARFVFGCPVAGTPGSVWGTGVYTSDSSVCSAALQAGLITLARGGVVTAEIRPGQSAYLGSTRNGVTSESYGAWPQSYVLLAALTTPGAVAAPAGAGTAPPFAEAPPAPIASLSPPLPQPVGGTSVDVKTFRGTVLVNGRPLTAGEQIPIGATVNAAKGTITMTSASPTGTLQTANFAAGRFKVLQKGRKGITELTLIGGDFTSCKRTTAGVAPTKTTIVRALWGNGKGQFTTNGRYAAATVRGTIWLTEDRCDGTLILVKRGTVTVVDHVHHRTVAVTAGHSYLA